MFRLSSALHRIAVETPRDVIQVVSLDAMNTLLTLREPPPVVYARYARHHNVQADETILRKTFLSNMSVMSHKHPCFGHNGIGAQQWWNDVILQSINEASPEPVAPAAAKTLAKELFEFYSDVDAWDLVDSNVRESLARIRRKGIPLAVVSNFDFRLKALLQEFDLLPLFDMVCLSGELGIEKPDPRIFQLVTEHFHLTSPDALLHVGDHPVKDFKAARDFGARAILFDPYGRRKEIADADKISKFEELKLY